MASSAMKTNVGACPDLETLAAYIDGRLTEQEREHIAGHLAECETCYFVFTEAAQVRSESATAEIVQPATASRKWLPSPGILWSSAAGLALAASLLVAIATGSISWRNTDSAELRALVAAVGTDRPIEPRLTGGFAYGQVAGSLRSGQATVSATPDVRIAAAQIERDHLGRREPQSLRLLGLAYVVNGDTSRAVVAFEQAADQAPTDAAILSDLSAAYIARGHVNRQFEDFTKALTMADRAVRIDSRCAEAWFNRALALEALNMGREASGAWSDYLKIDAGSPWADEAREHLRRMEAVTR